MGAFVLCRTENMESIFIDASLLGVDSTLIPSDDISAGVFVIIEKAYMLANFVEGVFT